MGLNRMRFISNGSRIAAGWEEEGFPSAPLGGEYKPPPYLSFFIPAPTLYKDSSLSINS